MQKIQTCILITQWLPLNFTVAFSPSVLSMDAPVQRGCNTIHQENSCSAFVGVQNLLKFLNFAVTIAKDSATVLGVSDNCLPIFFPRWKSSKESQCASKFPLVLLLVEV